LATALNFICKFYDSNFRGEQKTKERTFQITTNLFFSNLAVTVGASGVRDFEKHHCQAATEPSRLFIKHIFLYKNPSKTDWRKLNRAKTLKNYARPHYICTLLPPGFYSSSVC
jgi:hypothetical protein